MGRMKRGAKGHEQAVNKFRETMIKRHGSYENYKKFMSEIASRGGSKLGVKKGFAVSSERAKAAGRKGGKNSKRSKQDRYDRPFIVLNGNGNRAKIFESKQDAVDFAIENEHLGYTVWNRNTKELVLDVERAENKIEKEIKELLGV